MVGSIECDVESCDVAGDRYDFVMAYGGWILYGSRSVALTGYDL